MKKNKSSGRQRSFRFTAAEWSIVATFFATSIGSVVAGVKYFNDKFASIDLKFEKIDYQFRQVDQRFEQVDQRFQQMEQRFGQRFDEVNNRLDKIGADLSKTSDLLDLYLTWRFIYINDPVRKGLVPMYDPRTRTLNFVDKAK